jgi:hypothetical protein
MGNNSFKMKETLKNAIKEISIHLESFKLLKPKLDTIPNLPKVFYKLILDILVQE